MTLSKYFAYLAAARRALYSFGVFVWNSFVQLQSGAVGGDALINCTAVNDKF